MAAPSLPGASFEVLAQQADGRCGQELAAAERNYLDGAFSETVRLAARCLEKSGATKAEKVRAFRLSILAHLRQERRQDARTTATALLRAAPGYEPDPVDDPPSYVSLVTEARQEMVAAGRLPPTGTDQEQKPWFERRRTWLAVGGGLLLAGLIAIFGGG